MSEIRQDLLSRRWVIIGGERAGRPNEFLEAATRPRDLFCPFCAGHEAETPPAVATYGASGPAPWLVRVVPNKFPALTMEGSSVGGTLPVPSPVNGTRSVPTTYGIGRHEVIIESPEHVSTLSELNDEEVETVFTAYRDRLLQLSADGAYRYVQIFKNVGPAAGASLEHLHSQLIALPTVPEVVERELVASGEYFLAHGRSLLLDMLEQELAAQVRIVCQTEHFVAFCPIASRFGYEVWVAPRRHQAKFEAVEPGELGELSRLIRDVIGRIECAVGNVAYNYFLHTRPFDMPAYDHYHWHIEIIPRLTKVAGFEWSTGCFINPYPPESAAAHLRSTPPSLGRRGS
jgi:UDPglucose--hexose-1-phosphate uridylyltransferase